MTTHELAAMLLKLPNIELLVNDENLKSPYLETITLSDDTQAVVLWTNE